MIVRKVDKIGRYMNTVLFDSDYTGHFSSSFSGVVL